ncbi:Flp family type IVb pilin [Pseudochrobactrum sp. B5]|uniref:Flp family type IVb pilin n=1 Tax=Pseudochrobactrum sp. B5 TaxID=1289478 RepID=UPI000952E8EC|nr:Flp family type IVb pilin [Pseudochrobactrum sp. B5]
MIKNSFLKSENGATAIEYSLIAAFIGLIIVASLFLIGNSVKEPFNEVSKTLTDTDK